MSLFRRFLWSTVLLLSLVHAAPALAQGAPPGSDEASTRFQSGVAFYKARDFAAALVEFKRAYQLAPNYRVLFNLGQTSRELNDYATALKAFEQYLDEGGKEIPAARVKDVGGWIVDLKKKVGRIIVETNVNGAEILVDDVAVGKTPLRDPIVVNAGQRRFSATLGGYNPVRRAVEVAGSEESTLRLELTKVESAPITPIIVEQVQPPPPAKTPVAAWVMLSTTAACVVATGVLGGLAFAARGDLDDALAAFPGDAAAIEEAQGRTNRFAITTDVLGGVSIAGAITTIVLFAVAPSSSKATKSKSATQITPLITPSGLGVRGAF